jgi:two-component system, OmpR family, copper resistance phosphate regulon response regulator CusR
MKGHILLISSDLNRLLASQSALSAEMESDGSVTIAGNTARALSFIKATDFTLIVCDLDLPGLNAQKFLADVKAARPHSHILLVTPDEVDRRLLLRYGADDVIQEPASVTELVRAVEQVLRRIELVRRVTEANLKKRPGA